MAKHYLASSASKGTATQLHYDDTSGKMVLTTYNADGTANVVAEFTKDA